MTLFIDIGHNHAPADIGASSEGETIYTNEDKFVESVGYAIKKLCDKAKIKAYAYKGTGKSVTENDSLDQRIKKANSLQATFYLSLHVNAFSDPLANGSEVFDGGVVSKSIASAIQKALVGLGFRDRKIKAGKKLRVIKETNMPAVLVEHYFLTNKDDVALAMDIGVEKFAQVIFDCVKVLFEPEEDKLVTPVASKATSSSKLTLEQYISEGSGNTTGVDRISNLILERIDKSSLVYVTHPRFEAGENCDPYFQPKVAQAIYNALDLAPNWNIICNSAFRTPIRQFVLRQYFERGLGGITAAAMPGRGGAHVIGCAMDLENWQLWKNFLIKQGWKWLGMGDVVHFEIRVISGLEIEAIKITQKIINQETGSNLTIDGLWGDKTSAAALKLIL